MVPLQIEFFNYTFGTILIFLVLALLVSLFIFWHESRRDGFDEEKAFDLFLITSVSGFVLSRLFYAFSVGLSLNLTLLHVVLVWTPGNNIWGFFIGYLLPLFLFCKAWKWSFYRVSDIFSIAASFSLSITFLGLALINSDTKNLFISFFTFILFVTLYRFRLTYRSGLSFSLFLLFTMLLGLIFFRQPAHLIFYALLFTISMLNLYFRERKNPMKTTLPVEFVNKIRNLLLKKEKELGVEQNLLLEEDPYRAPGRENVEEYIDDVNEDVTKGIVDLRMAKVKDLRLSVRKALAKIKIGTYGICEVCGRPISKERLQAYPEATTCVEHSS